jgi:hypothetical protein
MNRRLLSSSSSLRRISTVNTGNKAPLTSTSTERNREKSPFLLLPPEIRNSIYEYGCVAPGPVNTFCFRLSHRLQPLPLVCKQVYLEAALLSLSRDTFLFKRFTDLVNTQREFNASQWAAITRIIIDVEPRLGMSAKLPVLENYWTGEVYTSLRAALHGVKSVQVRYMPSFMPHDRSHLGSAKSDACLQEAKRAWKEWLTGSSMDDVKVSFVEKSWEMMLETALW